MNTPHKDIGDIISNAELDIAIEAQANEDALYLDSLVEEAKEKTDLEQITQDWNRWRPKARRLILANNRRKIPVRKFVASFLVVALLATTTAFITVDAFRYHVLNLLYSIDEKATHISFDDPSLDTNIDIIQFIPKYIPEGYELDTVEQAVASGEILYFNDLNGRIELVVSSDDAMTVIDSEEADYIMEIEVNGYFALLSQKSEKESVQIVWGDSDKNVVFALLTVSLDVEEAKMIAESIYWEDS